MGASTTRLDPLMHLTGNAFPMQILGLSYKLLVRCITGSDALEGPNE